MAWEAGTVVIAPGGPARASARSPIWTDASSGLTTIAERSPARQAVFLLFVAAACLGTALGLRWAQVTHGHVAFAVAWLVIAGGVFGWGFSRAWRISVWFGGSGVTVRNFCRTYRISWPEVQCFADRSAQGLWALGIMLHDGRVVTASGAARDVRDARPETLAAVRQAAERYGIPAHLTGTLVKHGSPAVAAGSRPGNSRRGPLIAVGLGGAVLMAVIVAAGIMAASQPAAPSSATSQLAWGQLAPGDCLAGSNMALGVGTPWPDLVTPVACTQPHEAEVFYAGSIYPNPPAYPGETAVDNQAVARCTASFAAYDGTDYQASAFSYADVLDDASAAWSSGGNYVACVAYEPSSAGGPSGATPVNYSIKGSKK
jgi:hypothetical protein